jgi:cupin fold WbuC family metalloprotein
MPHDGQFEGEPRLVDAEQLRNLNAEAAASARKRSHLLLHAGHDDAVQRLLIGAQPGTYVRPHHHLRQWEMLVLQRGRMELLTFVDTGAVQQRIMLDAGSPLIQMPIGRFHMCIVHEPGTVVLEIKPGPYQPNEFADWSPPEGHRDVERFMRWAASAEAGERWQSS